MLKLFLVTVWAACFGCEAPASRASQLLAPPKSGVQLEMGPFQVPSGTEQQLCRTFKLPNDQPIAANHFEQRHTLGSHHMILFATDDDVPEQVFVCWGTVNFDQWHFVVDFQQKEMTDWQLPDGHAIILKPHQQVMIQAHYVNATTVQTPEDAFAVLNIDTIPMNQVKHKVGSMFTVNTNIDIPPHSSFTNHRQCVFNNPVELVAMTGHFHARGQTFDVWPLDFASQPMSNMIYQNTNWDNANFQTWNPPLSTPFGLEFSCTYFNDTDNEIVWGAHADVQEHCNLFFHYTMVSAGAEPNLQCQNGSGGW
jgi:hypothetical protein